MPEGMAVDTSSMYRIVLRCITTGGPATNVSWTKNCNPITEGTNSEVDNTVTSHYTHNLTIRRLQNTLDAVYTCSVSNNKPSRVSAVYPAEGA